MGRDVAGELLNFNIDRYLNPYVPRNQARRLPRPFAHFLGWRDEPTKEPPALVQWISLFVATVAGLCLVSSTFKYAPGLSQYNPPVIVASLGATAILDYNTIRLPLAQPRNAVFGQGLAALVGVCIAKLFQLNSDFENITWVSAAVACACVSLVMSMTNTIHPPGGATAILASTEASIVQLGWMFVPFALIGALLMLVVALLINNITRQYPLWWWTAEDCGSSLRQKPEQKPDDVEKTGGATMCETDSDFTLHNTDSHVETVHGVREICILPEKIIIPQDCVLTAPEMDVLEAIRVRMMTARTNS